MLLIELIVVLRWVMCFRMVLILFFMCCFGVCGVVCLGRCVISVDIFLVVWY